AAEHVRGCGRDQEADAGDPEDLTQEGLGVDGLGGQLRVAVVHRSSLPRRRRASCEAENPDAKSNPVPNARPLLLAYRTRKARPVTASPTVTLPRVLIVAPPKSASTHVAKVVRTYFALDEQPFSNRIDWDAEHNLIPEMLITLRGHGFCFNLHMLP